MKRCAMIGAALILLAGCRSAAADAERMEAMFPTRVHLQAEFAIPEELEGLPSEHATMEYLVYLPEGYWEQSEAEWPLIFFLHGAGDDDNDSAYVMSFGLPAVLYLEEQPEDFPFVVISPQAFAGLAWWDPETLRVLSALLDEVMQNYRIDPNQVYLTGLSMGGYGSWWLASTYPDRFAAVVSISGSGYRTSTIPGPELLCQLEGIPLWAIHGARDNISQPAANKAFAAALETTCETEVRWTLYDDVGHFGAYERAYRDPQLYEWLLEQRLRRGD